MGKKPCAALAPSPLAAVGFFESGSTHSMQGGTDPLAKTAEHSHRLKDNPLQAALATAQSLRVRPGFQSSAGCVHSRTLTVATPQRSIGASRSGLAPPCCTYQASVGAPAQGVRRQQSLGTQPVTGARSNSPGKRAAATPSVSVVVSGVSAPVERRDRKSVV